MTTVEKNSQIKVHYIGSFPESGELFDTSRKEVAKEKNIFNDQRDYAPLDVTMGEGMVIPGFENALLGMKVGEVKSVEIPPEDAYGHVNEENVVEIPDEQFTKANVDPQAGMMIQTSSGVAQITAYDKENGLVTLDFNHPLAGKTLKFELEVMEVL